MSDVPLGAMLSGGLDSSLIVALMARHMDRAGEDLLGRLREARASQRARRRARASPSSSAPTTTSSSSRSRRPGRRRSTSSSGTSTSRSPTSPSLGFLALSELAARARHRRALRPGRGRAPRRLPQAPRRPRSPARWQRAARAGSGAARRRGRSRRGPGAPARWPTLAAAGDPVDAPARDERQRATPTCARPARARRRSRTSARQSPRVRSIAQRLDGVAGRRRSPPTLYLDAQLGLVDDMLHYFDRASMAHSLEVRVPFLDHRARRVLRADPDRPEGAPSLTTKYVLKQAARGLVPDRIIDKRKIGFFNARRRRLVPGRRRTARSPTTSAAASRATRRSSTATRSRRLVDAAHGRAGRSRVASCCSSILMLEVWLSDVPAARDSPVRRRAPSSVSSSPRSVADVGIEPRPLRVLYSFPHRIGAGRIALTAWHQAAGASVAGADVRVDAASFTVPLPETVASHTTLSPFGLRVPFRVVGDMRMFALHDRIVARRLRSLSGAVDLVHAWPLGARETLLVARESRHPDRPRAAQRRHAVRV